MTSLLARAIILTRDVMILHLFARQLLSYTMDINDQSDAVLEEVIKEEIAGVQTRAAVSVGAEKIECSAVSNTSGNENMTNCAGAEQPKDDDFCIVTVNDSLGDTQDENIEGSDSMNNLFDGQRDIHPVKSAGSQDECFFDTVTEIKCVESKDDLHSEPSSITLTNVSSSTSNQYQPDEDSSQQTTFMPQFAQISVPNNCEDTARSKGMLDPTARNSECDKQLEEMERSELIELAHELTDHILKYEAQTTSNDGDTSLSSEDFQQLCDIIEDQKHSLHVLQYDREQLQDLVITRDRESMEIVNRLQTEVLRLKKQNTALVENRIQNGLLISQGMGRQLMKAKYDADKMLADSLNKQTKINELRLLILKLQQHVEDLEEETGNLKCLIDSVYNGNASPSEQSHPISPEKAQGMTRKNKGDSFNHLYNCDSMDNTPASGNSRNPLLSTLNTFSVTGRRRRRTSSDSQRSNKSCSSEAPSPSNVSQNNTGETERQEDVEAYLHDCHLAIEKSMAEY